MPTTDLLKTCEVGVFPEKSVHWHTPTRRKAEQFKYWHISIKKRVHIENHVIASQLRSLP